MRIHSLLQLDGRVEVWLAELGIVEEKDKEEALRRLLIIQDEVQSHYAEKAAKTSQS